MFRSKDLNLSIRDNFYSNFFVFKWHQLVSDELFFFFNLIDAIRVQTQKAREKLQSVLEVRLYLVHSWISNDSFLLSKSNHSSKKKINYDDLNITECFFLKTQKEWCRFPFSLLLLILILTIQRQYLLNAHIRMERKRQNRWIEENLTNCWSIFHFE